MDLRQALRKPRRRLGPYHRAGRRRALTLLATKNVAAALAGGLAMGALSVPAVRQQLVRHSEAYGLGRARAPQGGDYWAGWR